MASTIALALVLLVGGLGCDEGLQRGAHCVAASQCASNLCYANLCLEPGADDDGDGLTSGQEQQVGTDPLRADSDGDGKPDGPEAGPNKNKPLDTDGDGKPDAVESSIADQDADCLPDELDAHDAEVEKDLSVLVQLVCFREGVCAQAIGLVTAACSAGELTCNYQKVPGWQAVEACDGVDNDCDGQVDEGFVYQGAGVGMPCAGIGACGTGVVVCAAGHATCSTNPDGSQPRGKPEACNGEDDDCDGETDEDFSLAGLSIGVPCIGQGECGIGLVACGAGGQPLCSADPGGEDSHASAEACNGLDDDCDGQTDEGLTLNGIGLGSSCTVTGVCGEGVVQCAAGGQAVCSTAPGQSQSSATQESCNGKDDDCDGTTDEGFSLDGSSLGAPCPGVGQCGQGVIACSKAGGVTCSTLSDGPDSQAKPEVCNGKDDDCDGQTDEKLAWQGKPLGSACGGQGACGPGTVVCGKNKAATCSTLADGPESQAQPETCNGVDDDCDGTTDNTEQAPAGLDCGGEGVCQDLVGAHVCVLATWACTFEGQPGYEGVAEVSCDGLDNDCDGQTDEGLATVWKEPTPWEDGRPLARQDAAWLGEASGGLWLAGGSEAGPLGTPVAARDVWHLDSKAGLWKRVSASSGPGRIGAALWLSAAGTGGAAAKLNIVGGLTATGQPASTLALDAESGAWVEAALPAPPTAVTASTAGELAGQVWLFGTSAELGQALVQRWNIAQGAWEGGVPQLPELTANVSACQVKGTWFALGLKAAGQPIFASIASGAAGWQPRSTAGLPGSLGNPGRLVCLQSGQEVWWVGAEGPDGAWQAPMRFLPASDTWLPIADSGIPQLRRPVAWAAGASVVLTMGRDSSGLPQSNTFVQGAAGWSGVDAEPPTALGATWLNTASGLLRMGGALPQGAKVVPISGAWRWAGGAWQWLPMPSSLQGRVMAEAMESGSPNQVVYWGGATPVEPGQLWGDAPLSTAGGAAVLDLVTGLWAPAPMSITAKLPPIGADSASTATLSAEQRYFFSKGPDSGTPTGAELWSLSWPKGGSLVWQSADGPGPVWRRGTALTHDPLSNRLVLAQVDGPLKVWVMDLGAALTWKLAAADPAAAPLSRVTALGAPGYKDRLLVLTGQPPVGAATQAYVLEVGQAEVGLSPWSGAGLPWAGPLATTWAGSGAVVSASLTPEGSIQAGRWRFGYACGP